MAEDFFGIKRAIVIFAKFGFLKNSSSTVSSFSSSFSSNTTGACEMATAAMAAGFFRKL